MTVFNYRSADVILEEMITFFSALQPDVNVNEASALYMMFQVFSYTSAMNMNLAQDIAQSAFITTATDADLTNLAADRGVNRVEAEPSNVILTFERAVTGSSVTIPASSSFGTDTDINGNSFIFENFNTVTIPATSTSATGLAECTTDGAIGNIGAETIVNIITPITGLDTVTNEASAYGGVDQESDEDLRERVRDFLSNNTGRVTVSGYQQFLESLSGVDSALVYAASASMPNYITAIVTSTTTSDGIPTAAQLSEWQTEINKDENRAVVDVITVTAPTAVPITVTATITEFEDSADEAETRSTVQSQVISFINGLDPGSTVRVVDIYNVIHDTAGVEDFTLSAPVSNTTLTTSQKATASTGTVTIS